MCAYCYQILYQGCRHRCGALRHMKNLIEQTSVLEKERIANQVIQQKIAQSTDEGEGTEVKLRTFGRPNTYTVSKGKIQKCYVIIMLYGFQLEISCR